MADMIEALMPASLYQEVLGAVMKHCWAPRLPVLSRIVLKRMYMSIPMQGLGSGALQEFLDAINKQAEQVRGPLACWGRQGCHWAPLQPY